MAVTASASGKLRFLIGLKDGKVLPHKVPAGVATSSCKLYLMILVAVPGSICGQKAAFRGQGEIYWLFGHAEIV